MSRGSSEGSPLPGELLDWQVRLRAYTVEKRKGAPHVGVAPLVLVKQPGVAPGATAHSIVCGMLPRADLLASKTQEFRTLYETAHPEGSKVLYDRGLAYLRGYYAMTEDFDPSSLTTLVGEESPLVKALRAAPDCALVFHVFDIGSPAPGAAMRTQQLCCRAEVLKEGPVYENVWWHNALFHGFADDAVVIRFHHQRSLDTQFGRLEPIRD